MDKSLPLPTIGIALLACALALTACTTDSGDDGVIDDPPDVTPTLLDHQGALTCSDLESLTGPTTLADECEIAAVATVRVTAESDPIRAPIERVYEALIDPDEFGAFPRPLPPDFEPPPVPHSMAIESAGEPFIRHFRLFWGGLQTSTVSESHEPDRIEVVQLWRVNPTWTEAEVRMAYPDMADTEVAALVDTPFMDPGLRTIVRFTIERVANPNADYSYISMVQYGLPEVSYPIVKLHWSQLYFDPMKQYLEQAPPVP